MQPSRFFGESLSTWLPKAVADQVYEIARAENRTRSSVIASLVESGLEARRVRLARGEEVVLAHVDGSIETRMRSK